MLEEFIGSALQEHYREDAYSVKDAFVSDLEKRLKEYSPLPFYNAKENESSKDSILWKFANNVEEIVGSENKILFNMMIMNIVLRDINILQLEKLLFKKK